MMKKNVDVDNDRRVHGTRVHC